MLWRYMSKLKQMNSWPSLKMLFVEPMAYWLAVLHKLVTRVADGRIVLTRNKFWFTHVWCCVICQGDLLDQSFLHYTEPNINKQSDTKPNLVAKIWPQILPPRTSHDIAHWQVAPPARPPSRWMSDMILTGACCSFPDFLNLEWYNKAVFYMTYTIPLYVHRNQFWVR